MKKLILLWLCLAVLNGCKKNRVYPDELSKLPPPTQKGADTFGCLVDGKAFTPKVSIFSYFRDIETEYYYDHLHITATRRVGHGMYNDLFDVQIHADSLQLQEGASYPLGTMKKGAIDAIYDSYTGPEIVTKHAFSKDIQKGMLTITKINPVAHYISGTFYFDGYTDQGEVIHVTDGRFDVTYY